MVTYSSCRGWTVCGSWVCVDAMFIHPNSRDDLISVHEDCEGEDINPPAVTEDVCAAAQPLTDQLWCHCVQTLSTVYMLGFLCEAQPHDLHINPDLLLWFSAEPQDGVQPWFITKPKEVSAAVGQHVLLSCAIAGDPFPQYTWTRTDPSRSLTSGGDYELLQKEDVVSLLIRFTVKHKPHALQLTTPDTANSVFFFRRVKKEHGGEYLISLR